ncbi:tyrosine-type recombinase/integrase [Paracoccus sp. (in: a-proteobacteria)]|uniref:tyrosine-type recombinase/integrase n=1 Tax=Paracoccus sp. TaxID=267 RepID=UPI002AFE7954|nr:tyrosine-type recombinase/integrase [Paracoccus sp. (in: a-proteobacteria)]
MDDDDCIPTGFIQRVRKRLGIRDRGLKDLARKAAEAEYRAAWDRHLNPEPVFPSTRLRGDTLMLGGGTNLPPLLKHFGPDTMIEDIGEAEIVATGIALYESCVPDTNRRQMRVPISAVIRWAQGKRRTPGTDNKRIRWLTPEEAETLMKAAAALTLPRHSEPERHTLAKIAFMLGAGCRPSGYLAALVEHWNPASREWWIPAEEEGAGKTESSARWVRLPQRSVDLIGDLPEVGRAFLTPYGKPIVVQKGRGGQMQTSFNKARDAAGLDAGVTPHVLRHTWATWFYAQTRDFGALMDLGGWAKAGMASGYRNIAPADLADRLYAHGWDFRQEYVRTETPTLRRPAHKPRFRNCPPPCQARSPPPAPEATPRSPP